MSWDDTLAVKATIEEVPALAEQTFVTFAPVGPVLPTPYVIVHPVDGTDEASRFTGPATTEHPSFTLHIVGASANQAQVVTGLVKAKFVTNGFFVPPTVTGRRAWGGYFRSPLPVQSDTDVTPALIYQVVELGWSSDPA